METVSPNVEILSRKRKRDSESPSHELCGEKRWFYVLESEDSEEGNSDDIETVYSLQDKTTDFVEDTMDTLSDSSFSTSRMVEFEVASLSEGDDLHAPPGYDSSEPQDLIRIPVDLEEDSDLEELASSPLGLNCWQCGRPKTNPFFTFCDNCFRAKMRFFPPRPRKKRTTQDSQGTSGASASTSSYSGSSQEGLLNDVEAAVAMLSDHTSDTARQEVCQVCLAQPRNGGFIHRANKIIHIYACYLCSQKICRQNGRCPICNLRADDIMKVIYP